MKYYTIFTENGQAKDGRAIAYEINTLQIYGKM